MQAGPHSAAGREICPLAAQLAHLHRRLSHGARSRANTDPDALAIYVHALATEDVIVQVLLRRTQPLMLEHLPQLRHGASWQTDPETVRQYARVTCTATRTYLAHMDAHGDTAGVFGVFLIPVLERAARDIADLSGNRSHGRARVPSRGGRKYPHVPASSTMNDASGPHIALHVARLIIVDDHDLARDGLRVLLAGARRLCIIAEARSAGEAVALCTELTPDLALMDVRLPDMDGLDATRVIRARSPDTRVILFTMYEADDYAQEAVRAGAADYLLKGATRQELLAAIDRALHL